MDRATSERLVLVKDLRFYEDAVENIWWCAILLLKALWGLVDAFLLWGVVLNGFIVMGLYGLPSRFEDNFYCWTEFVGNALVIRAVATAHVDDLKFASQH